MDSKTIISIVTSIIILSALYYLVKGIDQNNDRKIVEVQEIQKIDSKAENKK